MTADAAAAQIADELEARLSILESLLGPAQEFGPLRARAEVTAKVMAAQLRSGDDHVAAQTAIDIAAAFLPDRIPDEFWATPLGQLIARTTGHPSADSVSMSAAGAMLGVSRARAQQFARDGRLTRHPDGGVTSASVTELARKRAA